jgi:predicted nucleic acid-binding protein
MIAVLDASITIARFHWDEVTPIIVSVFDDVRLSGACAPPFWKVEVANVLQTQVRKKRYGLEERDRILSDIAELNVVIDLDSPGYLWSTTIDLAHRHRLSVYDAIYLELAMRLKLPLATLDIDLRTAATHEHIPLLGL